MLPECLNKCGHPADEDTETFEGYCEECAAEVLDGGHRDDADLEDDRAWGE